VILIAPNGGLTPVGTPIAEFTRSAAKDPWSGPVRAMSDDGSYVFFDSPEALVPGATNHTLDTYQWHEGKISLVGSGTDPAPTYFLGYSPSYTPSGEKVESGSVFIGTHAKLVPQDVDSLGDIYAARVCDAESPCIKPPAGETAQCEGGSCQTPPPAPLDGTPSSLTFTGPGNVPTEVPSPLAVKKSVAKKTTKCKAGFAKNKRGRCVKKPKPKKRAKKSAHTDRRLSR
jgi:hypothetical protein